MHLLSQNDRNIKELFKRVVTGSIISIIIFSTLLFAPKVFSLLIFSIAILILTTEWPRIYFNIIQNNRYNNVKYKIFFYIMSFTYIIIPFILIIYFELSKYKKLNLYLFILIFAHDTGSYIFGKLFGFHKLCPNISPKKSFEGAFGGLFSVALFFIIFNKYNLVNINLQLISIFSLLISATALFGDLFESYLKRLSNLKDSGVLLPGHGGLLDRFDSILLNTYLIYLFKDYLM